jgi:F0F1-type ATP synthase assembly protein I
MSISQMALSDMLRKVHTQASEGRYDMTSLVSLGHLLAGVIVGGVLGLIAAMAIPGPQPWLLLGGLVLGGFAALQRRKFS